MVLQSVAFLLLLNFYFHGISATFPMIQSTTFNGVPENWYPDADTGPFVKIGEKYYYIETKTKANWFEAAHICRSKNANLASIENDAEFDAIRKYIEKKGYDIANYYWLAGNDLMEDKKYYWLNTGKPMTYLRWGPGNPDRYNNNEHCVSFWYNRNEFSFNDFDCKALTHYICQANTPRTVSFTIW